MMTEIMKLIYYIIINLINILYYNQISRLYSKISRCPIKDLFLVQDPIQYSSLTFTAAICDSPPFFFVAPDLPAVEDFTDCPSIGVHLMFSHEEPVLSNPQSCGFHTFDFAVFSSLSVGVINPHNKASVREEAERGIPLGEQREEAHGGRKPDTDLLFPHFRY